MVNIKINGCAAAVPEESTIMEACAIAGVKVPHLCYLKELNEIGACRLCSVEVVGENKLVSACNHKVFEGMEIITNSARVRNGVRTNLNLILSQHNCNCPACVRNGSCELQQIASEYGLVETPYEENLPAKKDCQWDKELPLIRDASKCIKCMRCIQVCDKVQNMGIWDFIGTGSRTRVEVAGGISMRDSDCTLCGQCITHCPVGALRERDDVQKVLRALEDPEITTVVQIAPAVRTAWGEALGLTHEEATVNRLAGALKKIGIDYVFDTSFTADLTIMEEGTEFLHRLQAGDMAEYPMFTSCCPGWVRFMKGQYPSLTGRLSSAKSPQQMFGSVIKSYFAEKIGKDPAKICSISIMPCTSKKQECDLPTMYKDGVKDVDYVLTTREVTRLIRAERLDMTMVEEVPFDSLMRDWTGAGVIFGATGGVMEAALRSAYFLVTGQNPAPDAFKSVRYSAGTPENAIGCENGACDISVGDHPWLEATFNLAGTDLHVAVVSGLAATRELMEAILAKKVKYEFVEVMACPGGCVGGGGQIIHGDGQERALSRGQILYSIDMKHALRFSHENEDVMTLYKEYMGEPYGELAEELLHTDHFGWEMP